MSKPLEVFLLFLRLGFTSFGGPLAHVAIFEDEFVRKRRWISREQFLKQLAITQMIPGPNSTELSMHLGHARAGWPGFFLAGIAFLTPAAVMVSVLAWLYVKGGGFLGVGQWIWGATPVVTAVILAMLTRTVRTAFSPGKIMIPALFGFVLYLVQVPMFASLMAAACTWLLFFRRLPLHALIAGALALPALLTFDLTQSMPSGQPTVTSLFLQMLYLGSIVLGSGYVLFSYYSVHIMHRLQWFDSNGLAMAIAAGQLTPGPLFASAAFFGQVLQGVSGAVACTVGIFLPAFVFSALSIPLMRRMEKSPWWESTLKVLGAVCILIMGREVLRFLPLYISSIQAFGIFAVALVAQLQFRVNSTLLILLGIAAGAAFTLLS